ncbi:DUF6817 domain-containing protein [Streptomyces hawaiiensis]|uniref:DUF6817 domain-containing protein n=1 Tax=Streptomyces hawaiiensis TaxID=67305 RepID=UPI003663F125
MPVSPTDSGPAVALLRGLGAADIAHPGGTLLTHLTRVQRRLAAWDARPALQLAGLCHAFYGTDGFPDAPLPLDRRGELAAAVGAEAEALVYLYQLLSLFNRIRPLLSQPSWADCQEVLAG